MIGTKINDRYDLVADLGLGGMGTVYRGWDTLLERDVAIKFMSGPALSTDGRARLLQEARSAAILDHPNIVSIYDVGESQGEPFIVMQYVEGETLNERPLESRDQIDSILESICSALEHAHEKGVVHRDIKPSNVIRTTNGLIKLMDFGVARNSSSEITQEGMLIGTIDYMAPEQARGQRIDGRADLYSFGVMLYELTTGKLPFVGEDPLGVISQHLHAPLTPPSVHNPEISPGLEEIITTLLKKNPQDRYQSAGDVLEAFRQMHDRSVKQGIGAETLARHSKLERIIRGRLVGRERELEESRELWLRVVSGVGSILLISGEPGIGKTRFVMEVATLAEVSGGQVYAGESFAEGNAPYAPFAQIIRDAFRPENQIELPSTVIADLIAIAPDLRILYPDISPNPPLDPAAEQQRLFESMVSLCTVLAQKSPLLLFLDDIHWADSGTLYLIRYLANRLKDHPVLVVAAYREIELDEYHPIQSVLHDLSRGRLATRLKLTRLGRDETETLLEDLFLEGITPDFLDGIFHETEGNPFFIEEVCKALVESGELYFEDGIWHRPSMEDLEIPQSIRMAIQSRVMHLPELCRDVLQWAAILGREFQFDTLLEMSDLTEDELIDALEAGQQAQLISEMRQSSSNHFEFFHALIPATFRDNLSGLRRGRLHLKAARAIEKLHPDDFGRLAYHYGEAQEEEKAQSYLIRAAEQAQQVYANEEALRYLSEALEAMAVDDPRRFELLVSRVKILDLLARPDEMLADINEMLALAEKNEDFPGQIHTINVLLDYYLATEHRILNRTEELASQALQLAREIKNPVLEAKVLRRYGIMGDRYSAWSSEWERGRESLQAATHLFKQNGLPSEAAACLNILRIYYSDIGNHTDAVGFAEEALELSREAGSRRQEAISYGSLAEAEIYLGDHDRAVAHAQEALSLNRKMGDLAQEIVTLRILGEALFAAGRPEDAILHIRQSLNLAESHGYEQVTRWSGLDVLNLHYRFRGEYESGIKFLDERLQLAREIDLDPERDILWPASHRDRLLMIAFTYNRLEMLEYMGQWDEALEDANVLLSLVTELGMELDWEYSWLSRLYALQGRWEDAFEFRKLALERRDNPTIYFNSAYVSWLSSEPKEIELGLDFIDSAVFRLREFDYPVNLSFALDLMARLLLDVGSYAEALALMEEVMQKLKKEPQIYGREQFYYTYSRALRKSGEIKMADNFLKRAYELVMKIADQTKDLRLRRSWLEDVRYNREIVRAFENLEP